MFCQARGLCIVTQKQCLCFFVRLNCASAQKPKLLLNQEESSEKILLQYKKSIKEQANLVKTLKEGKGINSKDVLLQAVADLQARKNLLEQKELELYPPIEPVNKAKLQDLLKQRFFYDQSFAIYGGRQGLYDFGPMGCAVQANLIQEWRKFFILEDHMLEVDCPVLTPEPVLKASGHLAKFTDYLVGDSVTGESFRADHLVRRWLDDLVADRRTPEPRREAAKEALNKLDSLDAEGLTIVIESFGIKSPDTGNQLTPPRRFNLMLETAVGAPDAPQRAFLRPETAQGIFVNFRRLLDVNNGRLPLAVAQIGRCFRNEIAPRSGLTRLREFTLAEVEHFYDPKDARHPKFASVASLRLPLLSAADQAAGVERATWRQLDASLATVGGPVLHETIAYYLGRVFLFLTRRCGVDQRRLRFRQHPPGEMAHYAADCWDAECLVTLGGNSTAWVECVGCADRSAYDLTQHAAASGERLTAERRWSRGRVSSLQQENAIVVVEQGLLAEAFSEEASHVSSYLAGLQPRELLQLARELTASGPAGLDCQIGGRTRRLLPGMLGIRKSEAVAESFVPCVVEPSFGIGRIISAALEHNFQSRENDSSGGRRTFLSLPSRLAPFKCVLLPMNGASPAEGGLVQRLSALLAEADLAHCVDTTPGASVGKRYARNDQIGVPYAVTVDHESVTAGDSTQPTVTLRERDSMRQIRIELDKVPDLIEQLVREKVTWQQAMQRYPIYEHKP